MSPSRAALAVLAMGVVAFYSLVEAVWKTQMSAGCATNKVEGQEGLGAAGATGTTTRASTHLETWADTPQGQVCHRMLPFEIAGERLSYAVAWEEIRPVVLNASYYPERFANLTRFRNWVSDLFDFYTMHRLRKSQTHPAPRESIMEIWDVIKRRIEDPVNNEPVRIAFFGGSVTTGRSCDLNPLDLPDTNNIDGTQWWCAYPRRLEVLLNRVLFPHRSPAEKSRYPIFEVTNMAAQATSSEVGAMAMEYNLLPSLEDAPPHIVVSSYSANDAHESEATTFWERQPAFVKAAQNLRPCDDHLPLVIMSDDWFSSGGVLMPALTNTGTLFKTAVWHNIMAIMYSNVVRAEAIFHFAESEAHPLFGSPVHSGAHLGMGFHIAQGYVLFFNLLSALHDACAEPRMHRLQATPSNPSPLSTKLATGLPTKHIGKYHNRAVNIHEEWERNAKFRERMCGTNATGPATTHPAGERPPFSTSTCAYAWVVNPMTPAWVGDGVRKAIDHVLVSQEGWGVRDRNPKSGWYTNVTEFNLADRSRSRFTIEVRNLTQPVDTFTLLSLVSYGDEWIGSRVTVEIEVVPRPAPAGDRGDESADGAGGVPPNPKTIVAVDGYHTTATSVLHPHRFRLSGAGASVGDTVRATFVLAGGKNFMVSGIAFCRALTAIPE